MRNIMAHIPYKEKKRFAERFKQIWLQPDKESTLYMASLQIKDYEKRFPEAIRCLENGLEDSLQFYEFPEIDKRRISSTNVVERIMREIQRRSRVIGVFPNQESYVRLITSYLIEHSEDWINERSYIKEEKLILALNGYKELEEAQAIWGVCDGEIANKNWHDHFELTEENNNLFLLSKGFGKGKGKVNILKKFHNYDANGRNYFEKLLPHLGKVWIFSGGEKKPRVFSSYDNFLSEIMFTWSNHALWSFLKRYVTSESAYPLTTITNPHHD